MTARAHGTETLGRRRSIAFVVGLTVLVAGLAGCGDGGRQDHEEALAAYNTSVEQFTAKKPAYDDAHAALEALVASATAARAALPADDPIAADLDAQLVLAGADNTAVELAEADASKAPKDFTAAAAKLREATAANTAAAERLAKVTATETETAATLEPLAAEAVLVDRIAKWNALIARWEEVEDTKFVPALEKVAQYCKSIGQFQVLPRCLDDHVVLTTEYTPSDWTADGSAADHAAEGIAAALDRSTLTGAADATARAAQIEAATATLAAELEDGFQTAAAMP